MKLSEAGELSLLKAVRKRFKKKIPGVMLGIGDDCAVINPGSPKILLTTDMMIEGVHFDLSWTTPFQLGYKLVSVNVSDIYAMGGKPEFVLLNFGATRDTDTRFFNHFYDGIQSALNAYNVSLIGGDMSSSERLVLSATVTGRAGTIVTRGGARPGDRIYVTGHLGEAAGGLELMKRIKKVVEIEKGRKISYPLAWNTILPLIKRHLMPEARDPKKYAKNATAMMDISDGLLVDLSRICAESGAGAKIYEEKIPISDSLKKTADFLGLSSFELAVAGGEDYELLFTAPEGKKVDAICIGEITHSGMKIIDRHGKSRNIKPRGYQHYTV